MWLCQQITILKKCHFRAFTGPTPCWLAQCNQNPSLLLLVGFWTTTSFFFYQFQLFYPARTMDQWCRSNAPSDSTLLSPVLHSPITSAEHYIPFPFIYLHILLALENYQRKLVKCIPKFLWLNPPALCYIPFLTSAELYIPFPFIHLHILLTL